ncbi:glycoside hydrolase family 130 protein [Mucilaginibacter boryungensis]|uniref:Glycoside hydrolase family 130 protein n=1 Tax=Mucilaginibacter boryungensis TaxID=768480 RepID=A0ABR9XK26_9SPHI|nr:glycoside hydrolase family 130 protein [Mucilaginibacter boryungensis]MBE9667360.1 glycoside hydrolase family 130 protein [Mucilaginibacter boryungensis]
MKDIARRFPENPLLSPAHLAPSAAGLHIACLLNPGVFQFDGKTWLLVRVAERPQQNEIVVSFPVLTETGETEIMEIALDDADLIATDARVVRYKGVDYLTTLSHLRLLCSDDGVKFYEPDGYKKLFGKGALQTFGIEDCRVTQMGDTYYLTFTAVSASGVGVGMKTTTDWKTFKDHGMILPPHNKDCAIFEEKINGLYYMLHRPSSVDLGGNYIWLAESPDGEHWGNHKCIIKTRADNWDNARVGAGCAPIKTEKGWLEIYHGASYEHRYCLGAFLLDLNEPWKVLARSHDPIMIPTADYELTGFFGHVVFTNGHIVNGDELTIYYGAADEHVCGAKFSIKEILNSLVVS